jgi:hypothetical protein
MRRFSLLVVALILMVAGCGTSEPSSVTTSGLLVPTTGSPATTTSMPATSTSVPLITTTTSAPVFTVEPIERDWTPIDLKWGVQSGCCDLPAIGPASPGDPILVDSWPADGFYDVTTTRVDDPPGVLRLAIRRWVPCSSLPNRCSPGAPADGIVADPASEVVRTVFMNEELTVVIRPIQRMVDGRFPAMSIGITGTGPALYELLSGFCSGYLPAQNTVNCGVDHAFIDWVWEPYRAGHSVGEIEAEILGQGSDPAFPLGQFDDGSDDVPCSSERACPMAYRGPHGAHLVVDPGLVEWIDGFPGSMLYGWWTSLEIRDGRPILYIDAGQIAG